VRRLLLATLVGMCAAITPPAHADGPGYTGTCRIATTNDTTPDATLGGQNTWHGKIDIVVAASTPGDTMVSASCWLKVNGGPESELLDATVAGVVGAGAGRTTFNAAVDDIVELCTHVTTTLTGASDVCVALTTTPVCPDPLCGEGGLLDQVNSLVMPPDPVCTGLVAASGPVDGLPTAGVLYVDPATGDVYAGGTTRDDMFWDCPPYVQD